jgi:hypothetical protein
MAKVHAGLCTDDGSASYKTGRHSQRKGDIQRKYVQYRRAGTGIAQMQTEMRKGKVQEEGRRSDVRSLRLLLASSRTVCAKRNVVLQALQRIATACATSNEKEWRGDWASRPGRQGATGCSRVRGRGVAVVAGRGRARAGEGRGDVWCRVSAAGTNLGEGDTEPRSDGELVMDSARASRPGRQERAAGQARARGLAALARVALSASKHKDNLASVLALCSATLSSPSPSLPDLQTPRLADLAAITSLPIEPALAMENVKEFAEYAAAPATARRPSPLTAAQHAR